MKDGAQGRTYLPPCQASCSTGSTRGCFLMMRWCWILLFPNFVAVYSRVEIVVYCWVLLEGSLFWWFVWGLNKLAKIWKLNLSFEIVVLFYLSVKSVVHRWVLQAGWNCCSLLLYNGVLFEGYVCGSAFRVVRLTFNQSFLLLLFIHAFWCFDMGGKLAVVHCCIFFIFYFFIGFKLMGITNCVYIIFCV